MVTPDQPLQVRILELGDMTVVGLDGDVGPGTASELDAELRRVLERDSTVIVLDCSLLESIGESEAAVLVKTNDRVRERHGRLVLRQPNEATRAALADAGLLDDVELEN